MLQEFCCDKTKGQNKMTPAFMNDKGGKGDYLLLIMRMLFAHERIVIGVGQCHEADEIAEADDYLNKTR